MVERSIGFSGDEWSKRVFTRWPALSTAMLRSTLTVGRDVVGRPGLVIGGSGCVGMNADLWGVLWVRVGATVSVRPFAMAGGEVASPKVVSLVRPGVVFVVGVEMSEKGGKFSYQVEAGEVGRRESRRPCCD